jgi:hypothetical protein
MERKTSARAAQQEYISRVDACHSTHGLLAQPWRPPKAALPAGCPFAQRRESQWSHQSGSMAATTCRPLSRARGWPAQVHGKQGCFDALFALGLMSVAPSAMVGWCRCKRRAVLFRALPSTNGRAGSRSTAYSPNSASRNYRFLQKRRCCSSGPLLTFDAGAHEHGIVPSHARWEYPWLRREVAGRSCMGAERDNQATQMWCGVVPRRNGAVKHEHGGWV